MERRAITVRGVVQGVGFRPFVYRLAVRHGLRGFVRNQAGIVLIEVEGTASALDRFLAGLADSGPPLSRIDSIDWRRRPLVHLPEFHIDESLPGSADQVMIAPDVATCDDCLAELFDPRDRRFGYPFLNCTNCGPRLTIIEGTPYDRSRTTMDRFRMCPACRAESEDTHHRRFHAQPTACPACGPHLEAVDSQGERIETVDALGLFVVTIRQGRIGALKGLGGYHLVCDARNQTAVADLRRRKAREEMPLAVMVGDVAAARRLCRVSAAEQSLLESPQRPIVLLRRLQGDISQVCDAVAPGNPNLGLMLPYTPLHHLLMRATAGIPLVMTSGNRTHEPIASRDDDAVKRLGPVADTILRHDRPIHVRCDDSVTRIVDGVELPIRRSRGYAPLPIRLPIACSRPVLAVGGQFKGVFALGRERQAILSHHMGDLDHLEAYRQFERDIALFEQLFPLPELIVHDLHPDYLSTHYARARATRDNIPCVAVQHHHAHMASCMAENGLTETIIGVTLDGTGFGRDETGEPSIWGGEFLVGNYRGFRRAAHLRSAPMPGGDRAVKEPWRIALAYLVAAGCDIGLLHDRVTPEAVRTVEAMLSRGLNAPLTSSAGRLFDAVASVIGIRDRVSYEGQAAMELEWAATDVPPDSEYAFDVQPQPADCDGPRPPLVIDTRPLIRGVVADVRMGTAASRIARRFHSTFVSMIALTCNRIRESTGLNAVVLSGGVFLNALLTSECVKRLSQEGFRVYRHRLVPPNDAGLCLGQLAIAAAAQSADDANAAGVGRTSGQADVLQTQ